MKQGRSLTDLAQELERQADSKKDYLADTRSLALAEDGDSLSLQNNGTLGITPLCHDQLAQRLNIPVKYYQRMKTEAPHLLARNVNHWFQSTPEKRLLRSLDGNARAFLSDRYRPLDNIDLMETVLPRISEMQCKVVSAQVTERRLYVKVITDRITAEVKKGDIVQAGLIISNSEVGCGSIKVEPLIYRLSCLNGMIAPDYSLKKYHVGRGHGDLEFAAVEFFKDETRRADDRAFWLKVRDIVSATLDQIRFEKIVDSLRAASERRMEGDPVKAIEIVSRRFTLTQAEQGSVLRHLIQGGDLSAYGLSNAVTRTSQDLEDYDRATEFERIGGEIIELPRQDWAAIATAN